MVYHVKAVHTLKDGSHGVFLTGLSCLWGAKDFPWSASRFRKLEEIGHPATSIRRREPSLNTPTFHAGLAGC